MKTLILSDIHSNIYALEAIWRKEHDSDHVVCTGDLVDYGPNPREVLAWIQEKHGQCVQGNHDVWVAAQYRQGHTLENIPPDDRAWVHLNASLLDEGHIQFLENLPKTMILPIDGSLYGIVHQYREYEEIVSLHAFRQFCAETFTCFEPCRISGLWMGHTHRQGIRYLADDCFWLNPGSVSYRRKDDPDQTAHYAILQDRKFSLKRLEYDIRPLYNSVQNIQLKASEMEAAKLYFGNRPSFTKGENR